MADLSAQDQEAEELAAPLGGTRSQAVQRLQVGLIGLAMMIMLVGLANVILDRAQEVEANVVPQAAATIAAGQPASNSDPLADAGVVPDLPKDHQPAAAKPSVTPHKQEDGEAAPRH